MKRSTIKKALENIRSAKTEVDETEYRIAKLPGEPIERHLPEFVFNIEGYERTEQARLERELTEKKDLWLHRLQTGERILEELKEVNPVMYEILYRYYKEGQDMETIGDAVGYCKASISIKIKKFFEEKENGHDTERTK